MTTINNSVLEELRRLYEERRTGTLGFTSSSGERIDIFFREGIIDAACSNSGTQRLGDYLQKLAKLLPKDLEALESNALREKVAFGEAAFRQKVVGQSEIILAARRQALDLIEYVSRNEFCAGNFTSLLRSFFAPARITFSQLMLELCRSAEPRLEECDSALVLVDNIDLTVYPWLPQELAVLSELRYPNTVQGLQKTTGMSETIIKRILSVLKALGVVEARVISTAADAGALDTGLVGSDFEFENLIPIVTNATPNEKLEVSRGEYSFVAEQFKNLKVQIVEADSRVPLKVLTVSSPDPQDGKSLISANLALSFAMDPGRRVIIVDCDLRSPSLHAYLGVSSDPGLLQYLGNGNCSPYCYVRRFENLYFMPTGGVAPNPIEVLSMQKMKKLIDQLRKDFDTVILDAPPYSPIADARVVTGMSDGLVMVLRRGKTSYSSTDVSFKSIDRNKLLGVVFNDVQPMLFNTYHNFGHYQYGSKKYIQAAPSADAKIQVAPRNYLKS